MRGFTIAGSVVFLGLLAAMFGSAKTGITRQVKQTQEARRIDGVEFIQTAKIKTADISDELGSKLTLDVPQAAEITSPDLKELTLTDRLDDFFLNNVSLENLPLGQAMALLKQMLMATDKQKTLALHKLIVSIPTSALGRLVTLHSTSISYLEAVKTLATMAGCDVDLGDHRITLKVQSGPWPQVAKKRPLLDMLDGFMGTDGKPMKDDANHVAWLKHDARRMGLRWDDSGDVSMTESQWQALRRAQDYRRRLELSLIPPFAVYVLPEGYLQPILQVTPQQVLQLMTALSQQGFAAYSDVPYAVLDPSISHQLLFIVRMGDTVQVSLHTTQAIAKPEVVEKVADPVVGGQQAAAAYTMQDSMWLGDVFHLFRAGSTDTAQWDSITTADVQAFAAFMRSTGVSVTLTTMTGADSNLSPVVIPVDATGTPVTTTETAPVAPEATNSTAPATP